MLVSDGEDLRKLPLSMRKTNLARLLARRVDGIHLAPFEQGEIGSDLFRHPSDGTGGRERARKAELRVSGYAHWREQVANICEAALLFEQTISDASCYKSRRYPQVPANLSRLRR